MRSERLHRIRADVPWQEPLTCYQRLRQAGHRPVLLDGSGAHPEARFAYLATSPAWEARVTGGVLHVDGMERPGPVLDGLRSLVGEPWDVDEPEAFTGGVVGMVAYEALRYMEPTLPVHEASTPEILLWQMRDVVAFDRHRRTAWSWCTDLPGEDEAARRQAHIIDLLSGADGSAGDEGADPEPAGLEAHGAVAVTGPEPVANAAHASGAWRTSLDQSGFEAAVERVRALVHEGDLFQANIATRFSASCGDEPADLFRALAKSNPSPFMALYEAQDHAVVSCSPEQLFAVQDGAIRARPIAGTRPRGADADEDAAMEAELLADGKEQAEHTMLVDLVRNDVARVSRPGSVHVPERMSIERYRHVMHMVSRVEGRLRDDADWLDCLVALFPGGTITGAPKHRACLRIHEAEPVARGPYTGSMGFVSWSHNSHWNILIRTMLLQDGEARVWAGSGIVADSVSPREWQEAGHKAAALLDAAAGHGRTGAKDRLGEVTPHGTWRPSVARPVGGRVLVIDNYDSFTYNLADYAAACGAEVRVRRNDAPWHDDAVWATHIILSPGPGRPADSGASLELLRSGVDAPVLGVCLGHQAMGLVTGVPVINVPPVHGKAMALPHGDGWLSGLPWPLQVARYHSLALPTDAARAAGWMVNAEHDGMVMAMRHPAKPWFGVQFHPESICTEQGLEMVARFLEAR